MLQFSAVVGLAATAAPIPQDRIITDDSPLPERGTGGSLPDSGFDPDDLDGSDDAAMESYRPQLVLGVVFFVLVLGYGLLRWQVRQQRR